MVSHPSVSRIAARYSNLPQRRPTPATPNTRHTLDVSQPSRSAPVVRIEKQGPCPPHAPAERESAASSGTGTTRKPAPIRNAAVGNRTRKDLLSSGSLAPGRRPQGTLTTTSASQSRCPAVPSVFRQNPEDSKRRSSPAIGSMPGEAYSNEHRSRSSAPRPENTQIYEGNQRSHLVGSRPLISAGPCGEGARDLPSRSAEQRRRCSARTYGTTPVALRQVPPPLLWNRYIRDEAVNL